ncbi:MAG: helix-turn-helix domain-containing protein, partial [Calditrichaeota bacterium]|nr:helix-turn-helix domain-containing protein [Calditrichota bacterium]
AMLLEALANNGWNQSAAARELGVSERTVRYQMKKFGIEKPD